MAIKRIPSKSFKQLQRRYERLLKKHNELSTLNEELSKKACFQLDFLSMITHELRTPLTTLRGYVSFIKSRKLGPLNHDQYRGLSIAELQIQQLNSIVDNLLDISKIESADFRIKPVSVNITKLIKSAVSCLMPLINSKGIILELKPNHDNIPKIKADVAWFSRVIVNLVNNAVKFSEPGGKITISVQNLKKMIKVCIADTGTGIAKHRIDKIFDRFSNGHHLNTKSFARLKGHCKTSSCYGSGLGLTIVKNIIEHHKGSVWLKSKVRKGTKFFFTLPK